MLGSGSLFGGHYSLAHTRVVNIGMYSYADFDLTMPERSVTEGRVAGFVGLTGRNGQGKSTIMDSILMAVQDDQSLVLNGAASKGVARRSRRGQDFDGRNPGHLVRGVEYVTISQDGTARRQGVALRGSETNQWGAAVDVFVSDDGDECSFGKFLYVDAGAPDGTWHTVYVWSDGSLDPREAASVAASRFTPSSLGQAFPGAHATTNYSAFLGALTERMGWGSAEAARRNLMLLAMIQRGESLRTVNEAVRKIGLDAPQAPELVRARYEDAQASLRDYRSCQESIAKMDALESLHSLHEELTGRLAERTRLEQMNPDGDGPFALWVARHRVDLAKRGLSLAQAEHESCAHELEQVEKALVAAAARRDAAMAAIDERGGDPIATLRTKLDAANQRLSSRTKALEDADALFRIIGMDQLPNSRHTFEDFQEHRAALLERERSNAEAADEERDKVIAELTRLRDRRTVLSNELEQLRRGVGRLPEQLVRDRKALTDALGVRETDLPFLAELVDVLPKHSDMRLAVVSALAEYSHVVLVEESLWGRIAGDEEDFATCGRLDLMRAKADLPATSPNEGCVSSLLTYDMNRECDLSGWVSSLVASPDVDVRVVATREEAALAGIPAVSADGALFDGECVRLVGEGADTLGFDNASAIEDCEAEIANYDSDIAAAEKARRDASSRRYDLSRRIDALERLANVTWESVDRDSADAEVQELMRQIKKREADGGIRALLDERDAASAEYDARLVEKTNLVAKSKVAETRLRSAKSDLDAREAEVSRLVSMGVIVTSEQDEEIVGVADEQMQWIAPARSTAGSWDADSAAAAFRAASDAVRKALQSRLAGVRREADSLRARTVEAMQSFKQDYPESTRMFGTDPIESYSDYEELLRRLSAAEPREGLRATLERFVATAAGSLGQIARRYRDEVEDVRRRLEPINAMLATIPFGDFGGRLSIMHSRVTLTEEQDMLARIDHVTHYALHGVAEMTDDELEGVYEEVTGILEELNAGVSRTGSRCLDSREAWSFMARVDFPEDTGRPAMVTDSYGRFSGGETEELSIFTMGAILRYRLSTDGMNEPTLRTVLLDEACLKSDHDHTARSIGALRAMGFQVITAFPQERIQIVSDLVDKFVYAVKNAEGNQCRLFTGVCVSRNGGVTVDAG